ncbi:hypothetical protein JCM8547_007827 [Rhodosporidiobolus lusitaniae]
MAAFFHASREAREAREDALYNALRAYAHHRRLSSLPSLITLNDVRSFIDLEHLAIPDQQHMQTVAQVHVRQLDEMGPDKTLGEMALETEGEVCRALQAGTLTPAQFLQLAKGLVRYVTLAYRFANVPVPLRRTASIDSTQPVKASPAALAAFASEKMVRSRRGGLATVASSSAGVYGVDTTRKKAVGRRRGDEYRSLLLSLLLWENFLMVGELPLRRKDILEAFCFVETLTRQQSP